MRRIVRLLACVGLAAGMLLSPVAALAAPRPTDGAARLVAKTLQKFASVPCAWSGWGDPRVIAHGSTLFSGCITPRGDVTLERYDLRSRASRVDRLYGGMEQDDHNNPSLVFFKRRLYVFSAPHSGYHYPRNRRFYVRYRFSLGPYGRAGFGRSRTIPLTRGCGLGYTYPNPVVSQRRLYLFLRGPCWAPYFTSTVDGVHWARPRTLLVPRRARRAIRPYAKYSDAPDGSILMAFTDGHPYERPTSLYYVRFKAGRFYRANGGQVGTLRSLPLRFGQIDRVAPASDGHAWTQDIAVQDGRPVIVYSTTGRRTEVFRYAWWTGRRWRLRAIADAGRGISGYGNAGISLDHADPRWVALVRSVGRDNQVEVRRTLDHGNTWKGAVVIRRSRQTQLRPVFPRGLRETGSLVVVYIAGTYRSFRSFQTVIRLRVVGR